MCSDETDVSDYCEIRTLKVESGIGGNWDDSLHAGITLRSIFEIANLNTGTGSR